MAGDIATAILELRGNHVLGLVRARIAAGDPSLAILEECRSGMSAVGERFERGDYFLAELMLSAAIFQQAVAVLAPHLAGEAPGRCLGRVVLATMRGDIHDLGKNLVATLLRAQSFEVHDLGVNVEPATLVETVRRVDADFVGFSSLITTSFESMKEAVQLLGEAGLRGRVKVLVGGGVTTPEVREYVGADFQTRDAARGVAYCVQLAGG